MRTKIAYRWSNLFSSRISRLLVSCCLTAPPILVGLTRFPDRFQPDWLKSFADTLAAYPSLFIISMLSPLLLIVFNEISGWANDVLRGQVVTNPELLFDTLSAIDMVVGEKKERFRTFREQLNTTDALACTIFDSITQPVEQYKALTKAVWGFFTAWFRDRQMLVRVLLVSMNPQTKFVESFVFPWPPDHTPDVTPDDLRDTDCAFTRAYDLGEPILIPDVSEEARKQKRARNFHPVKGRTHQGSLLCYRFADTPLAISVHTTKPGCFHESQREQWKWLLVRFEKRFQVEYNLAVLKDVARKNETC
jgi:hypothetical protein